MALEQLCIHTWNNETGPLHHPIHRNILKIDQTFKCRSPSHKTVRKNLRRKTSWPLIRRWILRHDVMNIQKIDKLDFIEMDKLDFIEIEKTHFCHSENKIKKVKRQPKGQENIFPNYITWCIREIQIKTKMRHQFTPPRMSVVKKGNRCWWWCGETGMLILCWIALESTNAYTWKTV